MAEKDKSIGALWQKQSQKGTWFSGNIEVDGKKYQIVAFPNNYKTEDKHPDFRILQAEPKTEVVRVEKEPEDDESMPF